MSTPPPVNDRARSQLAQLVGEVLIHQAPHTAKINADETRRQVDQWLDGLEAHSSALVGPFVQHVLDVGDPPDAVRALLEEAVAPSAAFSATLTQIFLYSVVSTIVSAATAPFVQGIVNNVSGDAVGGHAWRAVTDQAGNVTDYAVPDGNDVARPVDAATIATATGRGLSLGDPPTVSVEEWAYTEAANQGIDANNLNLMASIVGLPPALQELFEMVRRGVITAAGEPPPTVDTGATLATDNQGNPLTVEKGLQEGDFRDDWISAAVQLRHAFLTPTDFVNAAVREQMPYAEARAWAHAVGLDWNGRPVMSVPTPDGVNDMFGLAFSVAGRPPGPQELASMTHRGILPAVGPHGEPLNFDQGIAESDIKTKWSDVLLRLSAYLPTVQETATLLEKGGFSADQAAAYWAERGVDAAVSKALTYVVTQEHHSQERLLAKGDILKGYYDGIFTNAQATELLGFLGYGGDVVIEMLEIQDFRRQIRAIDQTVRKVGTAYEAFKLSAVDVLTTLQQLGLSSVEANALLKTWDQLRIRPLRVPTTTEIGKAVKYGTITQAEGLAELADLGYQPRDAAIVLSSEAEIAVVPLPAAGTTTTG